MTTELNTYPGLQCDGQLRVVHAVQSQQGGPRQPLQPLSKQGRRQSPTVPHLRERTCRSVRAGVWFAWYVALIELPVEFFCHLGKSDSGALRLIWMHWNRKQSQPNLNLTLGMCEGELIHLETNQPSEEGCQTRCMLIQGCRYYTYDRKEDFCYAFADCPTQSTEFCPAEECISGTPNCEIIPSYENALASSNHVIE